MTRASELPDGVSARGDGEPDGSTRSNLEGPIVGAIDIGTNSVLLLVARVRGSGLEALVERATITRLGENVDRTRRLDAAARERTLECLRVYARLTREANVAALGVVGTSAMRDAGGGEEFRADVERMLGVAPRVLSGEEEAELAFAGATSGLDVAGNVVVFDVGGGSTEVVSGAMARGGAPAVVAWAKSLDVGSVRLTERCVRTDPPLADELAAVRATVRAALVDVPTGSAETLVGVAGTVTTLAALDRGLETYDANLVHGCTLSRERVRALTERLAGLPLGERALLPGLEPKRADVIVCGSLVVEEVMNHRGANEILVSDRGVRWGLAMQLADAR